MNYKILIQRIGKIQKECHGADVQVLDEAMDIVADYEKVTDQLSIMMHQYEEVQDARSIGMGRYQCPACGFMVNYGNEHCRNCGKKLGWMPKARREYKNGKRR